MSFVSRTFAALLLLLSTPVWAETVLHRGNGTEPDTLDPQQAFSVPDYNILHDLYEGLTTFDSQGKVVLGQASHRIAGIILHDRPMGMHVSGRSKIHRITIDGVANSQQPNAFFALTTVELGLCRDISSVQQAVFSVERWHADCFMPLYPAKTHSTHADSLRT